MASNELEIIREYTDAGFRVFPLWGLDKKGQCQCGDPECKAILKHPSVSNWQHSPNWSAEQLDNMLAYSITTGFGVCLDDHLVLDIDRRNGGFESYDKLVADTGIDYQQQSGFVVATGGGGLHIYFKRPPGSIKQHLTDYPGIDFKSGTGGGSFVVGCGSLHASGAFYERQKGWPEDLNDTPDALLKLLAQPERHRASINGQNVDLSVEEVAGYLNAVSPDCDYNTWVKCGMAIHHTTNGTGIDLWDDWSNNSAKYPGRHAIDKHWHSFGKSTNPVTMGTLIHFAEEAGYESPVTFDAPASAHSDHNNPFPVDNVDLLRPPGFVGQVAAWIDGQCRYPRENLAVAAALVAVGNIAGLRYTDEHDTTTNLFCFARSASATGKEAIQQAMADLHRAANVHPALHGSIKSEQEIVRNLTRNQAAFYIIDEVGILLNKIINASQRGGAVYLEGVIGMLMQAYSKANAYMLLTGDTKEELRRALIADLKQAHDAIENNEDKHGIHARRMPQIDRALNNIDHGLEKPFVSLMGYTTPVTFDAVVTHEQATNGFIGRSLLFSEMETNPKPRKGFKKPKMTDSMQSTLQNLYSPGCFDASYAGRVEYYGHRTAIPTEKGAAHMMDEALDWFIEYAEQHKAETGLEAIARRSYEMMAKISLILAIPSGLRTTEHVRWAYAMARRDCDQKINLAFSNMLSTRKDVSSQSQALLSRIMDQIDPDHGETLGVLVNRNRKYGKDDIEKALQHLMANDKVRVESTKHPFSGKVIKKFYAV